MLREQHRADDLGLECGDGVVVVEVGDQDVVMRGGGNDDVVDRSDGSERVDDALLVGHVVRYRLTAEDTLGGARGARTHDRGRAGSGDGLRHGEPDIAGASDDQDTLASKADDE